MFGINSCANAADGIIGSGKKTYLVVFRSLRPICDFFGCLAAAGQWSKFVVLLYALLIISSLSERVSADFVILDDFDAGALADNPLADFRYVNDLLGDRQYSEFGLAISQTSPTEAVLYYDVPGGYDYGSLSRFRFREVLFLSFDSPETELSAIMKADGVTIATGRLLDEDGFPLLDEDGFEILEFNLANELGVVNQLSFHFSTNGMEDFSFSSSALLGGDSIQAVPEPTSILLVGTALACGAGHYQIRKRRKPKT